MSSLAPVMLASALSFTLAPQPAPNPADTGHLPPVRREAIVSSVKTDRKVVALTLDDGPSVQFTPTALRVAAQEKIPLTFFLVGQEVLKHPELVRAELAAGHVIGDHTWHHPLVAVGDARGAWEVQQTALILKAISGRSPTLFRPPGGMLNTGTAAYAQSAGFQIVTWDVFPDDTSPRTTTAEIVRNVLANVRPGSVILMHDGGGRREHSMEALPIIVRALKARGYTFLSVPDLLRQRGN